MSTANKEKLTKYEAKKPDSNGYVNYTEQEDQMWNTLITRQLPIIQDRACNEFFNGLEILQFSHDKVPQLPEINKKLYNTSGWQVEAVPALINFNKFFSLLADRKFPAATFIRTPEEIDYLQEPDIFHELFGHCPMLTNKVFGDFTAEYGKLGVDAPPKVQKLLARLYWFTIEFGLIKQNNSLKIYGGGILSSIGESVYALESDAPERRPFDIISILRTPYRIDIYQTVYFIINNYQQLFDVMNKDMMKQINTALEMAEFEPTFPPKVC